jgi:hypothetical protein
MKMKAQAKAKVYSFRKDAHGRLDADADIDTGVDADVDVGDLHIEEIGD